MQARKDERAREWLRLPNPGGDEGRDRLGGRPRHVDVEREDASRLQRVHELRGGLSAVHLHDHDAAVGPPGLSVLDIGTARAEDGARVDEQSPSGAGPLVGGVDVPSGIVVDSGGEVLHADPGNLLPEVGGEVLLHARVELEDAEAGLALEVGRVHRAVVVPVEAVGTPRDPGDPGPGRLVLDPGEGPALTLRPHRLGGDPNEHPGLREDIEPAGPVGHVVVGAVDQVDASSGLPVVAQGGGDRRDLGRLRNRRVEEVARDQQELGVPLLRHLDRSQDPLA